MSERQTNNSLSLSVPKFENKPCYNCESLERGISNFFDELFIINCHNCNVTIARGFFNTDSIEVFDSEPEDSWEVDETNKILESKQQKGDSVV